MRESVPSPMALMCGFVIATDRLHRAGHRSGISCEIESMAVTDKYVTGYDIATECGFGRRDPKTIPELLRIHQKLYG